MKKYLIFNKNTICKWYNGDSQIAPETPFNEIESDPYFLMYMLIAYTYQNRKDFVEDLWLIQNCYDAFISHKSVKTCKHTYKLIFNCGRA